MFRSVSVKLRCVLLFGPTLTFRIYSLCFVSLPSLRNNSHLLQCSNYLLKKQPSLDVTLYRRTLNMYDPSETDGGRNEAPPE